MLKEKPVQVDCQTGNVQDVCNGNAEISNYLTNLLCFGPKEGAAQIFVKYDNTHGYTFLSPESMRLEMAEKKQKTHTHQQNILLLMTYWL